MFCFSSRAAKAPSCCPGGRGEVDFAQTIALPPSILHLVFQNLFTHAKVNDRKTTWFQNVQNGSNSKFLPNRFAFKRIKMQVMFVLITTRTFSSTFWNDSQGSKFGKCCFTIWSVQGTHRRGRSSENFLMFCKMILDYENYEETLREDQMRRWDHGN